MIKRVKQAHVTACKKAVCTAPIEGHTKEPKAASLLETPHIMPKEEINGSVAAMAAPAKIKTVAHYKHAQELVYTIAGKKAAVVICKEKKLSNMQIARISSPENMTINGLFSSEVTRAGK